LYSDVHHGNGTEETVRWLRPSVETTPISGSTGEVMGLMQSLAYKPWHSERDAANVMFVSVHGYGPRERGLEHMLPMAAFYPGTGRTVLPNVTPSHAETPDSTASATPAASALVEPPAFTTVPAASTASAVPVAARARESGRGAGDMEVVDGAQDGSDESSSSGSSSEGDAGEEGQGSYGDGEGDSDEGESLDLPHPAALAAAGGALAADAVYKKVLHNKRMYSSFATVAGNGSPQKLSQAEAPMPPLILDIGVSLPSTGGDGAEGRGKVLDELHYRIQWRRYFREQIFPRLLDFGPDLIFVSAGFDAHKKDGINGGYIALQEEDFEWVTDRLVQLANSCCDGRIVSVLEGGYQLGAEYCSAFAQSAKVRCLVHRTSL
jgi:hypothetical protein